MIKTKPKFKKQTKLLYRKWIYYTNEQGQKCRTLGPWVESDTDLNIGSLTEGTDIAEIKYIFKENQLLGA